MIRTTALFAALAAAAATVSLPAYAGEAIPAGQVAQVHYADLNLASADGAQALKARVARAARRVCTSGDDRSLEAAMRARSCTREALARAMPQVELALASAGTRVAENSHVAVTAH